MAANILIYISWKWSCDQNFKNHSPKEFFNEIWFKVANTNRCYSTEIKFAKKKKILFKNGGQSDFCHIAHFIFF